MRTAQTTTPTPLVDKQQSANAVPHDPLASAEGFQSILDALEAVVVHLSWDGKVRQVNQGFQRLTGFSQEDVKNRHIGSVLLVADELRIFTEAMLRLRDGEEYVRFETYVLTKHGDRRRFRWSATGLDPHDGDRGSVLLTGLDMTEGHAVKQELVQAKLQLRALQREAAEQEKSRPYSATRGLERRRGSRRIYPYQQWIAPLVDGQIPPVAAFRPVRGADISSHGFSFITADPPDSQEFVVRLGSDSQRVELIANVVHVTSIIFEGRPMYLVGCRFTRRAAF